MGERKLCVIKNSSLLRPSAYIVREKEAYNYLINRLAQLTCAKRGEFPGCNPISLLKSDGHLLDGGSLCGLKSDGVRYIMMMCKNITGASVCVFIDRTMTIFEAEVWGQRDFFQGTVCDGELVWDYSKGNTPSKTYLMFDLYVDRGRICTDIYSERLKRIDAMLLTREMSGTDRVEHMLCEQNKICCMNNASDLFLVPKQFVNINYMSRLWQSRSDSPYQSDGIIIMRDQKAAFNVQKTQNVLKWKSEHTIDVVLHSKDNMETYVIYAAHNKRVYLKGCTFSIENNELIAYLVAQKKQDELKVLLECTVRIQGANILLFPIKVRVDKQHANSNQTISKTIQNVRENMEVHDVAALVNHHIQKSTARCGGTQAETPRV